MIIQVKVKPNAGRSQLLEPEQGDIWTAYLKAPPVDGKANRELIDLVARHFSCHKKRVSIRTGNSGRLKRVQVDQES